MFESWILVLLVFAIGTPIVAVAALVKANENQRRLYQAERSLATVLRLVPELLKEMRELRGATGPAKTAAAEAPAATATSMEPPPATAEPPAEQPHEPGAAAPAIPPSAPPQAATQPGNLEDALTSRWLVWLGAVAIALAGVFLVKYAIERDLLTPTTRVTLGLLLGLSLAVAGEALRRRPLSRAIAAVRPDYVPPALTASGLFVAFASIYSAYGVYALIGPLAAFVGLAAVALFSVGLSLLQGRFVALLGLLGGFATPALIVTPHPSAWALFGYLLIVECACLAVARYQAWWWLALATLAGAALWPFLWMLESSWQSADALPLGLYLLLTAAAFFTLRLGLEVPETSGDWLSELREWNMSERAVLIAGCVVAVILIVMAEFAAYNSISLVIFGLSIALYLFAARWERPFDILAVVSAAAALVILAAMPVPAKVTLPSPLLHSPLIPVSLAYFATTAGIYAGIFAVAGFVALWGARRPAIWAGVSAAVPVLALAIAYWRIVDFGVDLQWAAIATVLSLVNLFAAERVERYRAAKGLDVSLGLYAGAVVACLSLAAAMSLRQAWLTVALSLQLPALGLIGRKVPVQAIRILAGIVAGIVLVRLALNYNILFYPLGAPTLFNWILYGYGVPAAACFFAAREFRKIKDDWLVAVLEAAALAFAVLLVSLEIRLFVAGSLDALHYGLLEQSLQSIAWLAIGSGLAIRDGRSANVISHYGARLLLGAAAVQIVLLQLLVSNPLWSGEAVGSVPLLNVLSLAYLVPAAFAFAVSYSARDSLPERALAGAAIAGFVLLFADVSLEVRRAYQGAVLSAGATSDAELYTYSAVWLVFGAALLALGLTWKQPLMRYASLAVFAIVSIKVFLIDMSGLTGLYRVASFLGLGLSLVAIGYLYQRFVPARATNV